MTAPLAELIARLEATTEASWSLSVEIAMAVGWTERDVSDSDEVAWFDPQGKRRGVPHFSGSLDAALTLVPEGFDYGFSYSKKDGLETWVQRPFRDGACHQGYAPDGINDDRTRALALTIAALKARGAGVCPCCNRTFSQLSRHMQSKHPDVPFVPAAKPARGRAAR